jgi:VWFA-related protein
MPRTVRAALCALLALCALSLPARAEEGTAPATHYILLFDYPLGGLRQVEELSASIEGWIGTRLQPGDAVAVASYYGCELQVQQDFTRDRGVLAGAIADAVRGRGHEGAVEPDARSLTAGLPAGEELSRRTANFYGLLQVLAEASAEIPGRKNLLVFSKGFGRSHLFEADAAAENLSDVSGSPIQEKYLADRHLYEPTLAALREAGIALYPVDMATDYRETYPLAGVMCQLAAGTGGRYFYPVTDLPALLDRVAEAGKTDASDAADRIAGEADRTATSESQVKGRE